MKQIWKYKIEPNGTTHKIPKGGKILHVDEQHGKICMWVEVDPEECCRELRYFEVFGTGHTINSDLYPNLNYLGTVKLLSGNLVFHIYESKEN